MNTLNGLVHLLIPREGHSFLVWMMVAPVGLQNPSRLLEDIPNKIRDLLGIVVKIKSLQKKHNTLVEIKVPPYQVPISYKGKYYFRSGSTTKELTGTALNEFLLKKSGQTWDEVLEGEASLDDIDEKSVDMFKKEVESSGRFPALSGLTLKEVLDKLNLTRGKSLKRAAIVLFAKDPSAFYPNFSLKIGRFGKDEGDLINQDLVEGNLVQVLNESISILRTKYLKFQITYEGIQRIEKPEYPIEALREILLNALIHRNYMGRGPTLLRVFDDKIQLWNEGKLPENLTPQDLKKPHPSKPRNPILAAACFKAGYIDSWGRGISQIIDFSKKYGLLEPVFRETHGGFEVILQKRTEVTPEVRKLLDVIEGEMSRQELMEKLNLKDKEHFRLKYLLPAVRAEVIEMTQPNKPKSRNQKYKLKT